MRPEKKLEKILTNNKLTAKEKFDKVMKLFAKTLPFWNEFMEDKDEGNMEKNNS